jgi:hypothetical protein
MRGLLNPKVKVKVDYEEAEKYVSNIFIQWSEGKQLRSKLSSQ